MREAVGDRIARRVRLDYAVQKAALPPSFAPPPSRSKPWGTGHATLAAAPLIDGPFAVVNADDFYGAASYRVLAEHLRRASDRALPEHALVAFPLAATLSPDGPVSRGVCTPGRGRAASASVREVLRIERQGEDARFLEADGSWRQLPGATPVSLNFWGFTPAVLDSLAAGFERFLAESVAEPTAEYYLPAAVQALIETGQARVRVLGGGGPWAGLTYPGDRPRLVELVAGLTARGVYPAELPA